MIRPDDGVNFSSNLSYIHYATNKPFKGHVGDFGPDVGVHVVEHGLGRDLVINVRPATGHDEVGVVDLGHAVSLHAVGQVGAVLKLAGHGHVDLSVLHVGSFHREAA